MHMPDPQKTGLVHIVGIGGIGMSAIAEVMHTRGYRVQGSDLKDSANLERLRTRGISCLIGHDPANVEGAAHLVMPLLLSRALVVSLDLRDDLPAELEILRNW